MRIEKIKPAAAEKSRKKEKIPKKRVAAYVRVSTDYEEQLMSYRSQIEHYQALTARYENWELVRVYADQGITGTKDEIRDEFMRMIRDCMAGQIDIVITKSISRFSRNLVDTLQYVRKLSEANVTVIFEKENINTSAMEAELQLALLASLAQSEVESLSSNVKMGYLAKMRRGELIGGNGCLGYDYDAKEKMLVVNKEEAETVKLIFERYLEGYGSFVIAKELTALGKKNHKGIVYWRAGGIVDIIRNEKYMGALLLGKTYIKDPITKLKIKNYGEREKYYVEKHHEPIIDPEMWRQANMLLDGKRGGKHAHENGMIPDGVRKRKYAFSKKVVCGFCGASYIRRIHMHTVNTFKPVWKCSVSISKGKNACSLSKSIDEKMLEDIFMEMLRQFLIESDRIESKISEMIASQFAGPGKGEEELLRISQRRTEILNLFLEQKMSKDSYLKEDKELQDILRERENRYQEEKRAGEKKQEILKVLQQMQSEVSETDMYGQFERDTFELLVDKIIVGEKREDGSVDPDKITIVLKK